MTYEKIYQTKALIFIAFFLFLLMYGCKKEKASNGSNNPPPPPPIVNLAPGPFTVSLSTSSWDSITVTWTTPVDPENDTLSYRVYINDTLKADKYASTGYTFKNLRELTLYKIKVVAVDTKKNETTSLFETTTLKYWLRFLKKVEYGPITGYSYQKTGQMIRTSDGGYMIVGDSQLGNWPDGPISMFTIKTDSLGNKLWQKRYNYTVGNSSEIRIEKHPDGGYVVCGGFNLLKITNDGDLVWHKKGEFLVEETFNGIAVNSDGTIFTAGHAASDSANNVVEAVLSKYDANGNVLWRKRYSPTTRDRLLDLKIVSTNELVIVGTTHDNPDDDFWVLKTTAGGEIIWDRQYSNAGTAFPENIIITKEGNYVIAGFALGPYVIPYLYLQMIDANGNSKWVHHVSSNRTRGFSVAETNDNALIVTGGYQGSSIVFSALYKFDKSGQQIWEKLYTEFSTFFNNRSVIPTSDGGFIINSQKSKAYNTSPETDQIYLFKTDDKGNFE